MDIGEYLKPQIAERIKSTRLNKNMTLIKVADRKCLE